MLWFEIAVAVRNCIVSCTDLQGVDHTVEVTADSLYEAVAQGCGLYTLPDGSKYSWKSRLCRPPNYGVWPGFRFS